MIRADTPRPLAGSTTSVGRAASACDDQHRASTSGARPAAPRRARDPDMNVAIRLMAVNLHRWVAAPRGWVRVSAPASRRVEARSRAKTAAGLAVRSRLEAGATG